MENRDQVIHIVPPSIMAGGTRVPNGDGVAMVDPSGAEQYVLASDQALAFARGYTAA